MGKAEKNLSHTTHPHSLVQMDSNHDLAEKNPSVCVHVPSFSPVVRVVRVLPTCFQQLIKGDYKGRSEGCGNPILCILSRKMAQKGRESKGSEH